uniref:Exocyst complex component Sec3 PIP2-binding N-terminal domain-containing protein n=1 Tax=Neogobius melanostomus TaxID=47308 RepID=A0A8C6SLV9_9GOBI
MNNQNGLNKELFVPCGELLLVAVEVQRAQRRYRSLLSTRKRGQKTFLCVSVTKNKPQQLYISKVKKTGDLLARKSQWRVEELRQVNGINPHKDSPEFELAFDNTVDHWVTRSPADKCIFVQVLYGACKTHLKDQPGGIEGPAPSPAPRSLRARRKSYVPPKQTHFINCQPKLTRDAHQVNLIIYHCKALLNRMKSKMAAKKQYKDQVFQEKCIAHTVNRFPFCVICKLSHQTQVSLMHQSDDNSSFVYLSESKYNSGHSEAHGLTPLTGESVTDERGTRLPWDTDYSHS